MWRQGWYRCNQAMQQRWARYRHRSASVAVDLDSAWVTRFEVRLTDALQPQDVWFQLQAEAAHQAGLTGEAMALDFTSEPDRSRSEVLYRVFAVPEVLLSRVQTALQAQGWRLSRLGVYDTHTSGATTTLNFLPYRQMRLQRAKRLWVLGCTTSLLVGALIAHGLRWAWAVGVSTLGADASAQARAQHTWREAKAQHDAAHQTWQQRSAAQTQLQAQLTQQQQSMQWQAVLHANTAALWFEQMVQEGVSWRLMGQALSQSDVHHLQTQLADLPIWQTSPTLKQWNALPPSPQVGWPLWQFELVGVLREGTASDNTVLRLAP